MKQVGFSKKDSIIIWIAAAVFFILFIIMSVDFVTNTFGLLNSQTQDNLRELTKQEAQLVNSKIEKSSGVLQVLSHAVMQNPNMPDSQKMDILKTETSKYGFLRMCLADLQGNAITTDNKTINVADRQYFKDALNGKSTVSNLLVDRITNSEPIVVYATPIFNNGKVAQVLYAVNSASDFAKLADVTIFNNSCYSYVLNQSGAVLFHPNQSSSAVYTDNILKLAQQYNAKSTFAKFSKTFSGRGTDSDLVNLKNEMVYISYAPVDISDWMFVTIMPQHIVFDKSTQVLWRSVLVAGGGLFLLFLIAIYVAAIRKKNRMEIHKIAYVDRVTGIWNYNKFMMECEKRLQNKSGRKYAIIYFDIENFKVVNDVLGYAAGDKILIQIAQQLRDILKNNEIFARLSNDYFAILSEYHNNTQELVELVKVIKEKVNHITLDDNTGVDLSLPTGIYLIREDEVDGNKIINKANIARDAAKVQNNTERYAFFDEDMRKRRSKENAISGAIKTALSEKQFEVYYQAKFGLDDCSLVGYEALIRWNHPQNGLIRPDEFIPIAEKFGYITDIDRYVFECVCSDIHDWLNRGIQVVPVSFNLSRLELFQRDLLTFITKMLQQYQIPAKYVEAEITETATVGMPDFVQGVISGIRALGIKVSMDDFGTGASSLSCLRIMPIDILKLDKSFLDDVETDSSSRSIAKSVITLAKSLDLDIIAEGVETLTQAKFLANAGCDMVQGYYFAKPLKRAEAEQFMLKPMENLHLHDGDMFPA